MNHNIVILDDNFAIRQIIGLYLHKYVSHTIGEQFKVYTSSNGVEGLGYIDVTKPDIAIIDTTLPKYSGKELVEHLIARGKDNKMALIILDEGNSNNKDGDGYYFLNKTDSKFFDKLSEIISHHIKSSSSKKSTKLNILDLKFKTSLKIANFTDKVLTRINKGNIFTKNLLLIPWFILEILVSLFLTLIFIFNKKLEDENIEQEKKDLLSYRIRHYPTLSVSLILIIFFILNILLYFTGRINFLGINLNSIFASTSCPAALQTPISSLVILTPDNVDGIIDCSGYDVVINNGGEVRVNSRIDNDGSLNGDWGITLLVDNLTINNGGVMNANGKGYSQSDIEYILGRGEDGQNNSGGGGGGHAGIGGQGAKIDTDSQAAGGIPYGLKESPVTLGSAGGNMDGSANGGSGGGAIKIIASGEIANNGMISADGENGLSAVSTEECSDIQYLNQSTCEGNGETWTEIRSSSGGGAGGSIWIEADEFSGSGTFSAEGGNSAIADVIGGGGGGGYIVMLCDSLNSYTGLVKFNGGVTAGTSNNGGVGKVIGPTCRPSEPTVLLQYKTDNLTSIVEGGVSKEDGIVFVSDMQDPNSSETLSLQVEIQPLGTPFTGIPTKTQTIDESNPQLCNSPVGDCGTVVVSTTDGLVESTEYHWQARVRDAKGGHSNWVSYGSNLENERDFLIVGDPVGIELDVLTNSQTPIVNTRLGVDMRVKIIDQSGYGVPGEDLNWEIIQGGGILDFDILSSDSDGYVSNNMDVDIISGPIQVEVSNFGSPVFFNHNSVPGTATEFSIEAPGLVLANSNFSADVVAKDNYGNDAINYTGTVNFSPRDPLDNNITLLGTLLPLSVSFGPGDNGARRITNFNYDTEETIVIKAEDSVDSNINGFSGDVDVVATVGDCFGVDNLPVNSPITLTAVGSPWVFQADLNNSGVIDCSQIDLTVEDGATVEFRSYDSNDSDWDNDIGVILFANNLDIEAGGVITGDGWGYGEKDGFGGPYGPGWDGAQHGASHGGYGELNSASLPYGNVFQPQALGSKGGNCSTFSPGATGGGALRIDVVNTLTVNGDITSSGQIKAGCGEASDYSGGGSGGSIWIDTKVITGNGTIFANGSDNDRDGGGGRVALYYETNGGISIDSTHLQARGNNAGPGTVYVEQKSKGNLPQEDGYLYVDNNSIDGGFAALEEDIYQFTQIQLSNYGDLEILGQSSTLRVDDGSSLVGDSTVSELLIDGNLNYVGLSDFSLDGIKLTIDGNLTGISNMLIGDTADAILTLYANTWAKTGVYAFSDLTVGANGLIELISYDSGDTSYQNDYGVTIEADNIDVQVGGVISADGTGYGYEIDFGGPSGPGYGGDQNGSSYGGYGEGMNSYPYGDLFEPNKLGSKGGDCSSYNPGGNGGGAITLDVSNTLNIDGVITSEGEVISSCSQPTFNRGGGSGGSIWIDTLNLDGTGSISVNGADSDIDGGGGRIALYYENNNGFLMDSTHIQSSGNNAGPGTVYIESKIKNNSPTKDADIYIGNNGVDGLSAGIIEDDYEFNSINLSSYGDLVVQGFNSTLTVSDNTTIQGDATVPALIIDGIFDFTDTGSILEINNYELEFNGDYSGIDNISVANNSKGKLILNAATWAIPDGIYNFDSITVYDQGEIDLKSYYNLDTDWDNDFGITLQLNTLDVDLGGTISSDGFGYGANEGFNGPFGPGGDPTNSGGGASYGGYGESSINSTYDDMYTPTSLGSKGGNCDTDDSGYVGGGAMKIEVQGTLTNFGEISANAQTGVACSNPPVEVGGGSGGSIWIDTNRLDGTGLIQANGGIGDNEGSGGRVALYTDNGSFPFYDNIVASGAGLDASGGGSGTVFVLNRADHPIDGTLIIDNSNINASESTEEFEPGEYSFHNFIVRKGAELRVLGDQTSNSGVILNISGAFDLGVDSLISGIGTGFNPSSGTGAGEDGVGLSGGAGGGHGGVGGDGESDGVNVVPVGGVVYGDEYQPTTLGSGGGQAGPGALGGAGGGALQVNANDGHIQIDGVIDVSGEDGKIASPGGGGGAGGSISLISSTCQLNGDLIANGGYGGEDTFDGGGGSGGRISVLYTLLPCTIVGDVSVLGANSGTSNAQSGEDGTYPISTSLPDNPTNLVQLKVTDEVPVGGHVNENQITLRGELTDPGGSVLTPKSLQAEFELVLVSEPFIHASYVDELFNNLFNKAKAQSILGVNTSSLQTYDGTSPLSTEVSFYGLIPGEGYKWRTRTLNSAEGIASGWSEFGGNSNSLPDFTVSQTDSLNISADQTIVDIGDLVSLNVEALDNSLTQDGTYRGTVRIRVGTPNAIIPANYTYTSSDGGVHDFTEELSFLEAGNFNVTVEDTLNTDLTDFVTIVVNGPTPTPTPTLTPEPTETPTPTPEVTADPSETPTPTTSGTVSATPTVVGGGSSATVTPTPTPNGSDDSGVYLEDGESIDDEGPGGPLDKLSFDEIPPEELEEGEIYYSCQEDPYRVDCVAPIEIYNVRIDQKDNESDTEVWIEVCWDTKEEGTDPPVDIKTAGFVQYGNKSESILSKTTILEDDYTAKDHCMVIDGLEKDSEYIFKINSDTEVGKHAIYQGEFKTDEELLLVEISEEIAECISIKTDDYSFNASGQAILNFSTESEAKCTARYGNLSDQLNFEYTSEELLLLHQGIFELSNLTGNDDLLYEIECYVGLSEDNFTECKTNGSIPMHKYTQNYDYDAIPILNAPGTSSSLGVLGFIPLLLIIVLSFIGHPYIGNMISWIKQKERKKWGNLYDDLSKKAIPFANVTLIRQGKELEKTLAGPEGSYGFNTPLSEEMRVKIEHPMYVEKTVALDLFEGDPSKGINIDLANKSTAKTDSESTLIPAIQKNSSIISAVIFAIGALFTIVMTFISPSIFNGVMIAVYIVFLGIGLLSLSIFSNKEVENISTDDSSNDFDSSYGYDQDDEEGDSDEEEEEDFYSP